MDNKFVLSQSFNDVVFEKRHKKYGAYDIRRKYTRYAVLAGACAIFFFTCGSLTWAYVQNPEREHQYVSIPISIIPDDALPGIDAAKQEQEKEKEVPKQEDPKTSAAEQGAKTADITDDIDVTDDATTPPPSNLDAGKDPNGIKGGTGTGPVDPGNCIDCPKIDSTPPPIKIYEWTNHPPTCDELDPYLQKNIIYPQICKENGIEGTVYVQFIVDTKGDYRDVQVVKGPHPALNREALRVMSAMPKWTPAKDDNGVLVEYLMRKPIKFQLAK